MKRVEYWSKCDAKDCKGAYRNSMEYWEGMELPGYIIPDGWNGVRLNGARQLIYCPKHLVSVEVKPRFGVKK